MPDYNIILPSKPRVVVEEDTRGMYEIDGLYPGYGHTLGNSLRRIILSSIPGAAITSVSIEGVSHEFSTIGGVREDVVSLLLNLKKVRFAVTTDEPQEVALKSKGVRTVTASLFDVPGQVTVLNPDQHIAELTDKNTILSVSARVERGLGYIPKETLEKERLETGSIVMDAAFTPIRRVNYEVENMRVGDRTDFNRLRIFIETDGTLTPREALEQSIDIMIHQLKAIVGFKENEPEEYRDHDTAPMTVETDGGDEDDEKTSPKTSEAPQEQGHIDTDFLKTRIESLNLSPRTTKALSQSNIRTVGGLVRKREKDILDIEGIGKKGLEEIKGILAETGITLR